MSDFIKIGFFAKNKKVEYNREDMKIAYWVILTILFVIFFLFGYIFGYINTQINKTELMATQAYPTTAPAPYIPNSDKLWNLIEEWRQSQGLKPYVKDQALCQIATQRAEEQNAAGQLDEHAGFFARFSKSPYLWSENAQFLQPDYTRFINSETLTLQSWLHSPAHLANLEKPYLYSCVERVGRVYDQIFTSYSKN